MDNVDKSYKDSFKMLKKYGGAMYIHDAENLLV